MVLGLLSLITILCIAAEGYDLKYHNRFESVRGCQQYTAIQGHEHAHPYFATANFRNPPVVSNGTVKFRVGVLGEKNAFFRLAPQDMPYDSTEMHEIGLAECHNSCTVGKRYLRTGPATIEGIKKYNRKTTHGMMVNLDPLMFTITIYNTGRVTLTKDNESVPLYEFKTDGEIPSHKYIGFANWDVKLIFFFDCPLHPMDPLPADCPIAPF